MTTDPLAGLTDDERTAVLVCHDVYLACRHAAALDGTDHWDRVANRLKSAAFADTAPRFLEQCSRRFGVAHIPGPHISRLLALPPADARRILRIIRSESTAMSVLVRDIRDQDRGKKGRRITDPATNIEETLL